MVITELILNNLIHTLHNSLVSSIKGIVKRDDVSEDIAMISWQMIWERQKDFGTIEQLRAFLFISAKNMALTHLKGEKIRRQLEKENISFEEQSFDELRKIENKEFVQAARQWIRNKFPSHYLDIFDMTMKGFSASRIAIEINKSPSTITSTRSIIIKYIIRNLN